MVELPTSADAVVIGAGFAGASTAAELARRGLSVCVLEAEAIPGLHGSGRNAAMARRVIEDPTLAALATRSVALMRQRADDPARGPLIDARGGLLLGTTGDLDRLAAAAQQVPALATTVERLTASEVIDRLPALAGAVNDGGLFSPGCGVVDIHRLLLGYLDDARGHGASVHFRAAVTGLERDSAGLSSVQTAAGAIATRVVVNAAGFGVNAITAMAGLGPLPFDPVRRHLFVTAPCADLVARDAPFIWDVSADYYFRPEGDGLLMCACDATRWPPEDPPTDPAAREFLAERFAREVPGLAAARPARTWCGIRVMTPDGRFVIGPDPRLAGLFWVAGLGGHGMTTSAGVGEIAAEGIVGGAMAAPWAEAFAPTRCL